MKRTAFKSLLLLVAALLVGCAGVRPWERSVLSLRCMQINPDPTATAFEQHVYEYREGSAGGYETVGGNGCGCN